MPTPTTGSSNISELALKIIADTCAGAFYMDLSPSVWIATGYNNVEGASIKVTNPYGVVIKNFPTSGYDIYPPMSGVIGLNIPTQASNFQYGNYTFETQLTDSDGTVYTNSVTLNLCQPDANNATRNYGTLSAKLNGICSEGKLYVIVDTPPNYKGKTVTSQLNDFTLEYPTSSGEDDLDTQLTSFSTTLYEGVYKITGTICALYTLGDNLYVKVNYKVKKKKEIYCIIDECCVFAKLSELNLKLGTDCTDAEKEATTSIVVDALRLLKTAQLAADCGEDPSDYIAQLESVLGCKCTCNCNEGTPIINNNPSKDFNITGCNVTKTVVGLTDSYVIENYAYTITVDPNGGVLTAGSQTLSSCTKTQKLTFSIAAAYAQIKTLSDATLAQATFWGSIINKTLSGIDPLCLGVSQAQWNAKTFPEKITVMIASQCECCDCDAEIVSSSVAKSGEDALLTWVANGEYTIDIYLDGVLAGTVLSTQSAFTLVDAADGSSHTYLLVPKCENGRIGTNGTGTFTLFACAAIEPPSVSSNNVNGAACPYNLTTLVAAFPSGITAEWHTANNTSASSLLGNPTSVNSGSYWVFAKDDEGCYSIGINVIVVCAADATCTAPQTLLVTTIVGGNLVQFQSAAFPPPLNSYTVKRRLEASPDISGSYTTIGTPSWNPSSNRWEILDATATDNILYTYKAQSNCGDASTPNIQYNYANITCPVLNLGAANELVTYNFAPVGGGVDKYEVAIYDSTGVTLIDTDTHLPAFSNPLTGTFTYLSQSTTYKVRVKIFIGSYSKVCTFQDVTTTSSVPSTGFWYNATQYACPCTDPLGSTTIHSTVALTISKFYECTGYPELFFFITASVANPGVSVPEAINVAYDNCNALCLGHNFMGVPNASECSTCSVTSYPLDMYTAVGDTIPTIGMQCFSDVGLTVPYSGGGLWYKLVWNGSTISTTDAIQINSSGVVTAIGICSVDCPT